MNLLISYNWLKEFLQTSKSAADFAREFSLKSQTIDHLIPIKPKFKKVITAKVVKLDKHPNADKLKLATVDTGKEKITVVCGAPNIAEGQIVAYAQLGAVVIDSHAEAEQTFEIKKVNIRGQDSAGMVCSQKELGLGGDHGGIMVLPSDTLLGKPLEDVLALNDTLFDIEITSNRPDAMSVIGLALEGAAATGGKFKWREPKINLRIAKELPLGVSVEDKKLCPRYQAVVMSDVKIGPSPLWLQLRLIQAGRKPINNVVDITNYVALEFGQPTHVFDYDKLEGNKIVVRQANKGEKIVALDDNTYQLSADNLVIADAKNPVAVAGVMGGKESASYVTTTKIVFEVANFEPVQIRRTSRALNLQSDSSSLFEKGLHPEATEYGIQRCIELAQELAGAKVASKIIDVNHYQEKPNVITLQAVNVARYLGVTIADKDIKKILESLSFAVSGSKVFKVTPPWWRANDVVAEHDLIEEVARMYGYHNIPVELPSGKIPLSFKDPVLQYEKQIKHTLAGAGFTEVYNYSMVSEELLKISKTSLSEAIKIDNPLNEDMVYLRTTLAVQILRNVADNINNFSEQRIFELSNIYLSQGAAKLPIEQLQLCGAVVASADAFRHSKSATELILKKLGIVGVSMSEISTSYLFEKGKGLELKKGKQSLGQFGMVKQSLLDAFDIEKPVAMFDLNFAELASLANVAKKYQPVAEFPTIERDLSILIDDKITWAEIAKVMDGADSLIVGVEYLSTFVDVKLGKSKKSLTFRLILRAQDRTLKSADADQVLEKVVNKLKKSFNIEIR